MNTPLFGLLGQGIGFVTDSALILNNGIEYHLVDGDLVDECSDIQGHFDGDTVFNVFGDPQASVDSDWNVQ